MCSTFSRSEVQPRQTWYCLVWCNKLELSSAAAVMGATEILQVQLHFKVFLIVGIQKYDNCTCLLLETYSRQAF